MRRAAGEGLYSTAKWVRKKCWCWAPGPLKLLPRETPSPSSPGRLVGFVRKKTELSLHVLHCTQCNMKNSGKTSFAGRSRISVCTKVPSTSCLPEKPASLGFGLQWMLFNTTTLQENPGLSQHSLLLTQCRQLHPRWVSVCRKKTLHQSLFNEATLVFV